MFIAFGLSIFRRRKFKTAEQSYKKASHFFHEVKFGYEKGEKNPGQTTIKTTLYDLIEAISGEVDPGEDKMIVR
jgi:hypothetical protein